jgi:hypothetical protein
MFPRGELSERPHQVAAALPHATFISLKSACRTSASDYTTFNSISFDTTVDLTTSRDTLSRCHDAV